MKRSVQAFAVCVAVFALFSCNRVGRLGNPAPPASVRAAPLSSATTVRYFFDRTDSMRGFVEAGDNAEYVKTLKALWAVSGTALVMEDFYEYGESGIARYEFPSGNFNTVKGGERGLLKPRFYGTDSDFWAYSNLDSQSSTGRKKVLKTDGAFGPLAGMLKFVQGMEDDGSSLYVVLTDLYEQQNYGAHPIYHFYNTSFKAGLGAAFIAVEASYKNGVIYAISSTDENANIRVADGMAPFFICISGANSLVAQYCSALQKNLKNANIVFHSAVFLTEPVENIKVRPSQPRMASSRDFNDAQYAATSLNIDMEGENPQVQQYRLLAADASRWAAVLPLSQTNFESFTYTPRCTFYYTDGKKDGENAASLKKLAQSSGFNAKVLKNANGNAFSIVIETKNKSLASGHYRIDYDIINNAVSAPNWVKALNAPDIQTVRESVDEGECIKVLQLADIYTKITDAYNGANSKGIYTGRLYLTKR